MELMARFIERYLHFAPSNTEPPGTLIWFLGQSYKSEDNQWPEKFLVDSFSLITITYRSGIDGLDNLASDAGWGCMIRSTQTLLANAIRILYPEKELYSIVNLFADEPAAPFSIHQFVYMGKQYCDIPPGHWFGPSASSSCVSRLCEQYEDLGLHVYVAKNGTSVYRDQLFRNPFPILLLIPTRLGIDSVNDLYHEQILRVFEIPSFVGITGGRPRSAHYFYARQNQHLFYLDPHCTYSAHTTCQPASEDTFHTASLRRISLHELDPCMVFGFLFRNSDEAIDFEQHQKKISDIVQYFDVEPKLFDSHDDFVMDDNFDDCL
ncbi:Atg8 deconjugator Atg4 [Schizosaccharomyces cryophilus OY26]|uniref:Cysteine protease n=1 Tax=Schizosaccharomyces cryophilus (strain OY26 / ATCC MYA-4695 / CBS 11777 / NBRC 106824 / NRRL Y48691) TaxID=653667 RepID=S9X5U9_SCHCR|nr:Atg8 deconjugator Atg4 [Schizosaccharomyces cryophilus OY26]EPY52457.1 Atg8 deconjugator Atg4 [Schizosaccharomyces cryophilus OY26]